MSTPGAQPAGDGAAVPPDAVLLGDAECGSCRYPLRGLSADDRCPGCRTPVADALATWPLALGPGRPFGRSRVREWLAGQMASQAATHLRLAAISLVGAALIMALLLAVTGWIGLALIVAATSLVDFLAWLMSPPPPRPEPPADGRSAPPAAALEAAARQADDAVPPEASREGILLLIICCVPRLLRSAVGRMLRAARTRRTDLDACAAALAMMLSRGGRRTAYDDLFAPLPDRNPRVVLEDLAQLEGVVFLESEPPGLALTEETIDAVLTFVRGGPADPVPPEGKYLHERAHGTEPPR
jgi:hypothetical protein